MSRNLLSCRVCRRPMVRTHHSGRIDFLSEVEEDPPGRYRLTCVCGAVRDWMRRSETPAV